MIIGLIPGIREARRDDFTRSHKSPQLLLGMIIILIQLIIRASAAKRYHFFDDE
ncbi:hypothetical protein [Coleofasciculus sp.]|uniref:hypothetical protein n=1 Tax=Coleofasciculus sp. TaxID=3100458 RepID=UPI0039F8B5B2